MGQHCIVAEAVRRLSMIQELEAAVSANPRGALRLRQAVLSTAFTGNLIVTSTEGGDSEAGSL